MVCKYHAASLDHNTSGTAGIREALLFQLGPLLFGNIVVLHLGKFHGKNDGFERFIKADIVMEMSLLLNKIVWKKENIC